MSPLREILNKKPMNFKKQLLILILSSIGISLFSQELKIGDKLPPVILAEIKGGKCIPASLNALTQNKVVILEFWETWCGPCISSMPHLKQLYDKFKDDVTVIAVCHSDLEKSIAFIEKNAYPFHFLFDKEKELSKLFPHDGIPHTILLDRQGNVSNKTSPSYITEEVISSLIDGKNTNLPQTGSITSKASEDTEMPLFSFKISRYKLGEAIGSVKENWKKISFQYVFGYEANMFKDSVEETETKTITGMPICGLYQIAYGDLNIDRIVYSKELSRLDSYLPQHLYNASFTISDWVSGKSTILQKQLDIAFNLHSYIKTCDTTVLVLKDIIPNDSVFRLLSSAEDTIRNKGGYVSDCSDYKISIESRSITKQEIANILETFLHIPVIANTNMYYQANLKWDSNGNWKKLSIDEYIEMLRKYGIILEKQLRKIDYVHIEN